MNNLNTYWYWYVEIIGTQISFVIQTFNMYIIESILDSLLKNKTFFIFNKFVVFYTLIIIFGGHVYIFTNLGDNRTKI